MSEDKEQTLEDVRQILQRTEREQRKIEGGAKGKAPHAYSVQDAQEALQDWGTSGSPPEKNVAKIIKKK